MKRLRLGLLMLFALAGLLAAPSFAQEPEDEADEQGQTEEAEEPAEPEEEPADEPVEEPAEEPSGEPENAPADESADEPAEGPAETPAADAAGQVPDPPLAPPAPPPPATAPAADPARTKVCGGSGTLSTLDAARGMGQVRNESGDMWFFHRARVGGRVFEFLREGQRVNIRCSEGPNPQVVSLQLVEN